MTPGPNLVYILFGCGSSLYEKIHSYCTLNKKTLYYDFVFHETGGHAKYCVHKNDEIFVPAKNVI